MTMLLKVLKVGHGLVDRGGGGGGGEEETHGITRKYIS